MTLHPEAAAHLGNVARWMRDSGLPPWQEQAPPAARQAVYQATQDFRPPMPEMAVLHDHQVPGRGGPFRVRLMAPYQPAEGDSLPVILYFHGGGYVLGGIDESEPEARRLAQETPALVVSASYRLAPEHPFPAAVTDAYDALIWTAHNAGRWGGDASRLVVAGTSAGGGLAAAVARLATSEGGPRIALLALLCPWLDLTLSQPSVAAFGQGYGLDRAELQWYADCYLAAAAAAADPLISPALHDAPPGMPATAILAAECDPLRDETERFAERLQAAGARVSLTIAPGMIHAFNTNLAQMPAGDPFLAPIRQAIAERTAPSR